MSREIDSAALTELNRVLGIAGPGSATTELDDGILNQVIDVAPIVRRSFTVGNTGWFFFVMENVHSGADAELSSADPYGLVGGAVPGAIPPYTVPVPLNLDVWLLSVMCKRSSGAGALSGAMGLLLPLAVQQGWGIDDTGAPVVEQVTLPFAFWDSIEAGTTAAGAIAKTPAGEVIVKPNMRIPRGCQIRFASEAGAAAEFQMVGIIGLFPATLGQDVAV